ncbi:Protein yippee-like 1 [Vulpes lagopus]
MPASHLKGKSFVGCRVPEACGHCPPPPALLRTAPRGGPSTRVGFRDLKRSCHLHRQVQNFSSCHNKSVTTFSSLQSFQGSQGRAYLFNSVVNVGCGPAEERVLLTGLHAVADIYCENCKTTLGWKYEHAFESSQKYKEGKFIIELAHMIKDNGWE